MAAADDRVPLEGLAGVLRRVTVPGGVATLLAEAPRDLPDWRWISLRACRKGDLDDVRLLIAAGLLPVDAGGPTRVTHLGSAAARGHLAVVAALLQAGADVDAADTDGWTALTFADAEEQGHVVEALLAAGADPRSRHRHGWSPLHRALRQLLVAGDDVVDMSRLRAAVSDAATPGATWLIEARDADGNTPLYAAAYRADATPERLEALRLLLAAGADPNTRCKDGELAAWETMRQAGASVEGLRLLLDAGTSLHWRDATGGTLLHRSAEWGNAATTGLILSRGADLEARDHDGRTPLLRACDPAEPDHVRALLAAGADIYARDADGGGCLHQLQRTVRGVADDVMATVDLLREAGVDVALRQEDGSTAADVLRRGGEAQLADYLQA